jgi:hypothetical protein
VIRKLLVIASILSFAVGAFAQQQVAFLGETFTYEWGQSPQFQAHKNWVDYATTEGGLGDPGTNNVLGVLQTIIASGKKPIIHLVVGQTNADALSPGNEEAVVFARWAQGFEEIIETAQAAKLTIIVGTIPYALIGNVHPMNQWIFLYCNAHGIPVVNYDFALNSGTGFAASGHGSAAPGQPAIPEEPAYWQQPVQQGPNALPEYVLTSQGDDLITDMAEVAIGLASGVIKLKGGYLGTVYLPDLEDAASQVGANSGIDGSIVQFTAYGQYTDGSVHVINNADMNGHVGTWTTSAPMVLNIDQNGVATPLDKGTANIHFTTLAGQTINEWVWTTSVDDKCDCTSY